MGNLGEECWLMSCYPTLHYQHQQQSQHSQPSASAKNNIYTLLGGGQARTPIFCLKSFAMGSVQVGKVVFVK